MNAFQVQTRLLKMLAHPTRLRLLLALRDGEQCVCHLTAIVHQRQAYVSQQLMFLRQAGLLEDRKVGPRVYYRVQDRRLYHILDALDSLAGTRTPGLASPLMDACSCPKCQATYQAKRRKRNSQRACARAADGE